MTTIMQQFGKLTVYLVSIPIAQLILLFIAGWFAGWFLHAYLKGTEVVVAGKIEKHRGGWTRLIMAGIALLFALLTGGSGTLLSHWHLLVLGCLIAFLFFRFRWWAVGAVGLLLLLSFFLAGLLFWTLHVFTGKTAVLEVKVRSEETRGRDEAQYTRISLIVKDLEKGTENIYYVNGDKWGISANVVLFDDWVVFLGGKTYYRLNAIVGATDTTLDMHAIDEFSQPLWEELETNETSLPGVRAIYEDIVLKSPVVGREYVIYIDNDGALVPEVKN
ncbi:MAG TPA: hypothetical protein PKL83_00550 [bacterium]|nr:hypothetical protein [bacterium]